MNAGLKNMRTVVEVDVTSWSVRQREQLESAIAGIEDPTTKASDLPANSDGWNVEAFYEAMAYLRRDYGVQAATIAAAMENGTGFLDRESIQKLAGWGPERQLKGITRPVNRITQQLIEAGKLPTGAQSLLDPDYDPYVKGYQRARGYRVPEELLQMYRAGMVSPAKVGLV